MRQVGPGYCTHFMGRLRKWYIAPQKKNMWIGTMMLNQRIQGIPHLMGEVCQGMKGLGMLDTLEPKVG